jgi:hypothetical protein
MSKFSRKNGDDQHQIGNMLKQGIKYFSRSLAIKNIPEIQSEN